MALSVPEGQLPFPGRLGMARGHLCLLARLHFLATETEASLRAIDEVGQRDTWPLAAKLSVLAPGAR